MEFSPAAKQLSRHVWSTARHEQLRSSSHAAMSLYLNSQRRSQWPKWDQRHNPFIGQLDDVLMRSHATVQSESRGFHMQGQRDPQPVEFLGASAHIRHGD